MEPMLEMFIFETRQNLEQLEQIAISSEKSGTFSTEEINTIFRIMHTIKGSAAMMLVNQVAALAHSIEDIFFFLRESKPEKVNCSLLTDIILDSGDFIRLEIEALENGGSAVADASERIEVTKKFLAELKEENGVVAEEKPAALKKKQQYYIAAERPQAEDDKDLGFFHATLHYVDDCEMENIRAYAVVNTLQEHVAELYTKPEDLLGDENSVAEIRAEGFQLWFSTDKSYAQVKELLDQTIFLKEMTLEEIGGAADEAWPQKKEKQESVKEVMVEELPIKPILQPKETEAPHAAPVQTMISVNVAKLDLLMDLVGELVIAEAMVTQHPELRSLELDNFYKAARRLKKISGELQDSVMSIRMVPLKATFQKMNRIVRDMSKKLAKETVLILEGEDTEVDKNVIEHISDPLMHLIRNSVDHGIELPEERERCGKARQGTVTLSARNEGNEVLIQISDDGKGLNRERILEKARENGLIYKNEADLTDQEIYGFIFAPGFSTKEKVTEFSGRGVGMDVVMKNINAVSGTILVDSEAGRGSVITLKIPLTLAIISGMTVRIGACRYTVPIAAVRESFRPEPKNIVRSPDGVEMILVRGECYPLVRLHRLYGIGGAVTDLQQGIVVMVESEKMTIGIFADALVGQQQIVVKPLPTYIRNIADIRGVSGCTLLGDGSISLILDAAGIAERI